MTSKMEKQFEEEWKKYQDVLQTLAIYYQIEYINPYLKKMGYDMCTGNGTYWIGYQDVEGAAERGRISTYRTADQDELPKEIRDVLEFSIPGINYCLGSWMVDYKASVGRAELIKQGKAKLLSRDYFYV